MAIKTRQQIRDFWNSNINTNASQAITGGIMNEGGVDIIDSVVLTTEAENYQWFNDTDPASIGIPASGTYYQGVYNDKRWLKTDDDRIIYSQSGLWTIYDNADTAITPDVDWLGNVVRWSGTANGTITLDNNVLNFQEGWHFGLYNNTATESILVTAGGGDVIRSYNNNFNIPAYSYANIGLIFVNGNAEWYADIQQEYDLAVGQLAKGNVSLLQPVVAATWTLIDNSDYLTGNLVNMTPTANGGLQVNYPDNGANGVYLKLTIMASMAIPSSSQELRLSFGVDGVISTAADVVYQGARSGASQTADMFWPFSMTFEGIVANGSIINPFIWYSDTDTISVGSLTITAHADALTGVDITTA